MKLNDIIFFDLFPVAGNCPVSILYKSISGRYRPVRVADGPITARYRFIKNAGWGLYLFVVRSIVFQLFFSLASDCN